MSRIPAPEEAQLQKQWYVNAKKVKIGEVDAFIKNLMDDHELDYGSVCHAITASALAAAYSANSHEDQGHITGFQASAVLWEFIAAWQQNDNPKRLLDFGNMLYPQYAESFEKVISPQVWAWLQQEARHHLIERADASPVIVSHWQSIVAGQIPFGYKLKEED
jgi:hypothetical protein